MLIIILKKSGKIQIKNEGNSKIKKFIENFKGKWRGNSYETWRGNLKTKNADKNFQTKKIAGKFKNNRKLRKNSS